MNVIIQQIVEVSIKRSFGLVVHMDAGKALSLPEETEPCCYSSDQHRVHFESGHLPDQWQGPIPRGRDGALPPSGE